MEKKAILYRMATPQHICPFGIKSLFLLKRKGYTVEDHLLATREEINNFKAQVGVETTPQTFIDGQRIGGHDDLRRFFGKKVYDPKAKTYKPIIALFAIAAFMSLALNLAFLPVLEGLSIAHLVYWFATISMCLLALQKLKDIEAFSNMFIGYDLLAQKSPPYAYIYPFAEAAVGILMLAGIFKWASISLALFIGIIGAASVIKAVYIDKRDLKCACVGGNSNVPLGFISLLENLGMVAMAVWMIFG